MLSWDDIRTVGALVEEGALARAARRLGVSYTTIARRVQRAEAELGQPLFDRLADGYVPTEAGRRMARHARAMQDSESALLRELAGQDQRLSGPLTITAPQLLIAHVMAPVIAEFRTAHPEVDLRIRATNDLLDLSRREADLALRISRTPGDSLTGLRLTAQVSAVYATPDWAARLAADPAAPLDWIVYEAYRTLPDGVDRALPGSRVTYVMDDMVAMLGAAESGLGALRVPIFLGDSRPGLVRLPQVGPMPYADLWVVGHPDVWKSAKAQAFRDVLVPFVRARRARFAGA